MHLRCATTFFLALIATAAPAAPLDVQRIERNVRAQVAFGPRPSGSAANEKVRAMLVRELKSYGLSASVDTFHEATPLGRVRFGNVVAEKKGKGSAIVIIAAHFDTKRFERFDFVGANDGASGVAGVLEIARIVAASRGGDVTFRFVLFDGEEAFCARWSECMNGKDNTYGSRREVERLRRRGHLSRVKAMILLDMIGDRDLRIRREQTSTQALNDTIWRAARRIGVTAFSDEKTTVIDDHAPFLAAGVPAVDLIDFEYPWWHTAEDTMDKVSAESIALVVRVVLEALPEIAK